MAERITHCECGTWACEDLATKLLGNGHHPKCRHFVACVRAVSLLGELVKGIKAWAAEEDGVPDWIWEPYREACFIATGSYPQEQPK